MDYEGQLDVTALSDDELFEALTKHGLEVGPILPSTRKVYERKLTRVLRGDNSYVDSASGDPFAQDQDLFNNSETEFHSQLSERESPRQVSNKASEPVQEYETSYMQQVRQRTAQQMVDTTSPRNLRNVASPRPPIRDVYSASSSQRGDIASRIVEQVPMPAVESGRSYSLWIVAAIVIFIVLAFAIFQSMENNPAFAEVTHTQEKMLEDA